MGASTNVSGCCEMAKVTPLCGCARLAGSISSEINRSIGVIPFAFFFAKYSLFVDEKPPVLPHDLQPFQWPLRRAVDIDTGSVVLGTMARANELI